MEKSKRDNCTVVICSCDQNADTWDPFFKIFQDEWPDCPYPVVLNTESLSYDDPKMGIRSFRLYPHGKSVAWGKRLIETLKRIETPYVLFLLDDFFLLDRVDEQAVLKCMKWMEDDPRIAVFSFQPTLGRNLPCGYEGFELRPQNGEYRLNCQAAIWRRERLIAFTRAHESPWEWELYGSIRSRRYRDLFFSVREGTPPVFNYYPGGGLHRGKWVPEAVHELFQKHNITIDPADRGFWDPQSDGGHKRSMGRGIINRVHILKSILF